ncbi:MAG: monovalent cation/H(+) antiporter subunit G [Lachnospiraceae bacterium]|nr:monovalent cation/H(+) antiporter subunit G [Lachnospiraceae bacterium]
MEVLKYLIAMILLLCGVGIACIATVGVFKFKYVLNRMHAAAMCDTLALMFALLGVAVIFGISFTTLKLVIIITMLWLASPVSSHLIARLEVATNEEIEKECEVEE